MALPPESRLGSYARNGKGLAQFHPKSLEKGLKIQLNPELVREIHRSAVAVGKLSATAALLPNPDHFVYMYLRLEAIVSSRIEGTQASLMDLLQYEQEWTDGGRPDDLAQVSNHLALLQTLESRPPSTPLTLAELERLHARLLVGTRGERYAGKIRTVQNWIGPPGPIETAIYVPPPPREVRGAMNSLVRFINNCHEWPPAVVASVAHVAFESIHPFVDGNGRLGRYLIHFILWRSRMMERPVLYLSHYLRAFQQDYYGWLQRARDGNDLEGFCLFMIQGIADVAEEAYERSKLVLEVRKSYERTIRERLGRRSGAALTLVEAMYRHPIADIRRIAKWTAVSEVAAASLAYQMVDVGLLAEITGRKRSQRFALEKYLELFTVLDEEL